MLSLTIYIYRANGPGVQMRRARTAVMPMVADHRAATGTHSGDARHELHKAGHTSPDLIG